MIAEQINDALDRAKAAKQGKLMDTGEDDDANVGCYTAAAANTKPLILLCLMSVILLALRLKRKRRICSNQK